MSVRWIACGMAVLMALPPISPAQAASASGTVAPAVLQEQALSARWLTGAQLSPGWRWRGLLPLIERFRNRRRLPAFHSAAVQIDDMTQSPLQTHWSGAVRELRHGIGRIIKRQLLAAAVTFLVFGLLKQVTDHAVLLVLQWGPVSALGLLWWAAVRTLENTASGSVLPAIVTTPFVPTHNGVQRSRIQRLGDAPLWMLLAGMMAANVGSQWCYLNSLDYAGPVTSAASGIFQGLMLFVVGIAANNEKRWRPRLAVMMVLMVSAILQPLTAWLTGEPASGLGFAWGIGAAFNGMLISVGFKALSYGYPNLDARLFSILGSTSAAVFGLFLAYHTRGWDMAQVREAFTLPAFVWLGALAFGVVKMAQYMFMSRETQSQDFTRMAWSYSYPYAVYIGVNTAGQGFVKLFGLAPDRFPSQPAGLWSTLLPFVMNMAGILLAAVQADRPGLRRILEERRQVRTLHDRQRGSYIAFSGSASISEGPLTVLAYDTGLALERYGFAPWDSGERGLSVWVRRGFAFARGPLMPKAQRMQSTVNDRLFQEEVPPYIESLLRLRHLHARNRAQIQGTSGLIALPDGEDTIDKVFEALAARKPVALLELSGSNFWSSFRAALPRPMQSHLFLSKSADEAVSRLKRLRKWSPETPYGLPAEEAELEKAWYAIDTWPKAVVLAGQPKSSERVLVQSLVGALLHEGHVIRLTARGAGLWRPVTAAADALGLASQVQAVLHARVKDLTHMEHQAPSRLLLESASNHQVLAARKDTAFVFFWDRGAQAFETLRFLSDLRTQIRLGQMDPAPIILFGREWEALAAFFDRTDGLTKIMTGIPDVISALRLHAEQPARSDLKEAA